MPLMQRFAAFFQLTLTIGVLAVSFLSPEKALSLSASFPKTDSVILAQIQDQIAARPDLISAPIQVEVTNAVVSLSGRLGTKKQALALIVLAESIAGVESVDASGLSLQKGQLKPDDIINSLVIGTFYREGLMGPLSQLPISTFHTGVGTAAYSTPAPPIHLQVETQDGVVYLSGSAPDQATIDKAEDLARSVEGVVAVKSSIVSQQ
jgi:hypothetical protein